ncbi:hypothetical protein FHY18_003457 [Xanthomonas arboricola]|uniref:hypothetical protein n=1 Tax=Xanthomonas sp. 3793 TaxID=3035312 RepID=UPI002169BD0D|nr:hypothetical protein [Xanthomonas sp. 3793]MCS3747829.1 hypothetical protein [Xanthomonas sp. 3793]
MKRAFLALTIATFSFLLHAETPRSNAWRENLHLLGENGGSRSRLVDLLGTPAITQQLLVSNPTTYLKSGPAHCFAVSKGQTLQAWYYPIDDAGYWVMLKDGMIQYIAFEPAHSAPLLPP